MLLHFFIHRKFIPFCFKVSSARLYKESVSGVEQLIQWCTTVCPIAAVLEIIPVSHQFCSLCHKPNCSHQNLQDLCVAVVE